MNYALSNAQFLQRTAAAAPATRSTLALESAAFSRERSAASPGHLTPRQLEVLALLCEGLPNKLICRRLNIATGTVKVHIACIFRELGVTTRLQAVVASLARDLPDSAAQ